MSRTLAVLLALGLLGIWGAGAVGAATLEVGPGQTYTTIQAALNAANTGDVVVVAEGTYKENIGFKGEAITVESTNPLSQTVVAATIINGNKAGSVVTFKSGETANSVLSGFTLTNGSGSDGGGVYCYSSSPTLINNTISGNSASSNGGGVACEYGSSPTLTNDTISENAAGYWGGGVFCDSSSPTLINNTISGNTAADGGGVYCDYSSPTLTNDTISGNVGSYSGGGVACVDHSSPTLTNDTISENATNYGGGVFCQGYSSPTVKNTIVADNTQGRGLFADDSQGANHPVIAYCDFYGNKGGNYRGWPIQTGKNGNIAVAPAFANTGAGNFYLKSKYGRWAPHIKKWVIDTVQSPCIDAGDPTSAFNLEPTPNGGRINMGADGNTIYASKSPSTTTSAAAALTVSAAAVATSGGSAQIVVTLASAASVDATILNVAGREIAVLPAQDLAAGVSTMRWDGRSALGTKAPAGPYLVRVTARAQDGGQAQALVALELRR